MCVCFVYFLFAPYACDVHSLRENHKALKCHILPSQLPCKLFSDLLAQVSWNILQDVVFVHVGCKPCGHVDFSTIDELISHLAKSHADLFDNVSTHSMTIVPVAGIWLKYWYAYYL